LLGGVPISRQSRGSTSSSKFFFSRRASSIEGPATLSPHDNSEILQTLAHPSRIRRKHQTLPQQHDLPLWLESRSRIDDRVRSIVHNPTFAESTKDSIIGHFFSVYTELHRSVSSGSTVHSVRAAFERAVEHPSGKASAALWKLFVLFELRYGDPARAKEVFYRGMRAAPWAKPFMMLAFTHMKDSMTFEELRKVYNVLGEKELRVHVDLEDAFERHDERTKHRRAEGMGERMAIELPHDASSEEEE
jgi:hypothetical protein